MNVEQYRKTKTDREKDEKRDEREIWVVGIGEERGMGNQGSACTLCIYASKRVPTQV